MNIHHKGLKMNLRLRRKQASHYLAEKWGVPVAPSTLAKYATLGGGPKYEKFGHIPVYEAKDLDDWVSDRLSVKVRSSTELRALKSGCA